MNAPVKVGVSSLSFHYGKTLHKLAQTYISLHEAILEAVQNSIDSNATKVGIKIDRKKRVILIYDNGDGVTRGVFGEALSRTGNTMKGMDKLGQFGLGLIAHLGKCKSFSFTSCARVGNEGYQEWTFDSDEIAQQAKHVEIPYRKKPYVFAENPSKARVPDGMQAVNWRTCVRVRDYVQDKHISRIQSAEALKEAILEKYGVAMRRNDVSVSVEIVNEDGTHDHASGKAKRYSGKKLPEVTVHDKDAGATIFRMHLARKGTFGFRGKVSIGISNDDFRIPFQIFAKEAGGLLPNDLIELFKSGTFEGEIISQNAKLHDTRKTFVNNDAYVGFCTALETWFLEHGKKHMKEAKEERKGERLQNVSLKNLQSIEALMSDPAFERFRKETIGSFKHGTVGEGHAAPDKIVGTQENASISTRAIAKSNAGSGGGHSNGNPDAANPKHTPYTAAGPKGSNRAEVKGHSQGLQLDYAALRADGPPWKLEPKNGTIFFNIEHPEWVAAYNAGDRELTQWQDVGVVMALVRFTLPEEYQKAADLFTEEAIAPLSFLIRNSSSFNLTARIRASKTQAK